MIRVLIVDDHAVVRQGLRFMLERQADISHGTMRGRIPRSMATATAEARESTPSLL